MSSLLMPQPTQRPAAGLVVVCADCQKEFRSSELVDRRCIACRAHRACADVLEDLDRLIRRHRRYLARGIRPNIDQVERLRRRLLQRIFRVVPDFAKAAELANKEFTAIASAGGLTSLRVLDVVDAKRLITSL